MIIHDPMERKPWLPMIAISLDVMGIQLRRRRAAAWKKLVEETTGWGDKWRWLGEVTIRLCLGDLGTGV